MTRPRPRRILDDVGLVLHALTWERALLRVRRNAGLAPLTESGAINVNRTNHWLWGTCPISHRQHLVFNGIQGRQISRLSSWPISRHGNRQDKGGQINGRILGWI
jgi:hypothetical protein